MFNLPSFLRIACGLASCALAMLLAASSPAQSIDISLNVFYEDPADIGSGGSWQVVAKSSHSGIGLLSLRLDDIDPTVQFHAPRGTVNGSNGAGFWLTGNSQQGESRNVTIGQAGIPAHQLGGGEQSIFYGVGTIMNGQPGAIGPTFTSLTNVQNVPWAPNPPGDAFGEAAWNVAALFASGTFAEGVTPSFPAGTAGQVFMSVGTSTTFAPFETASISTIVRTNFDPGSGTGLGGDFNDDGIVDAADYVIWRKNDGGGAALPNDGGLGTPIGSAHYTLWRANFGNSTPGSGAGTAVPEPTAGALAALALGLLATRRRRAAATTQPRQGAR